MFSGDVARILAYAIDNAVDFEHERLLSAGVDKYYARVSAMQRVEEALFQAIKSMLVDKPPS
jgi:hypothetical protein